VERVMVEAYGVSIPKQIHACNPAEECPERLSMKLYHICGMHKRGQLAATFDNRAVKIHKGDWEHNTMGEYGNPLEGG
ncbi:hypothetical protein SK128_014107, partial [Halocaridina rubra]